MHSGTFTVRPRVATIIGLLVIGPASLFAASAAIAGEDPLIGGTTTLNIGLPQGVTMGPVGAAEKHGHNIKLPITGGAFDPVAGSGTETLDGGIEFRFKGNKTKATNVESTWGSGSVTADIAGDNVKLFKTDGGTVGRNGFGGKVTDATLKLTTKGAQALNSELRTDKRKPFRSEELGTAKTSTDPETVEVVGGTATLALDPAAGGKLFAHGVNPTTGGLLPIAPATVGAAGLTFPVTGGSLAPDATSGVVNAAGGAKLTKNEARGAACDAARPVGTSITLANVRDDKSQKIILVDITPPVGSLIPNSPLGDTTVTAVTADPTTLNISATQTATTTLAGALGLSAFFGSSADGCGSAATDFAAGDPLGTLTVSATTH